MNCTRTTVKYMDRGYRLASNRVLKVPVSVDADSVLERWTSGWVKPTREHQDRLAAAVLTARREARRQIVLAGGAGLAAYATTLTATLRRPERSHTRKDTARPTLPGDPSLRGGGKRKAAGRRTAEVLVHLAPSRGSSGKVAEAAALVADADLEADPSCSAIDAARRVLALLPVVTAAEARARTAIREFDLAVGRAITELRGEIAYLVLGSNPRHVGLRHKGVPLWLLAPLEDLLAGGAEGARVAICTYRPGGQSLATWLRRGHVLAGARATILRRLRPEVSVLLPTPDPVEDPEEFALRAEQVALVREAVARLPRAEALRARSVLAGAGPLPARGSALAGLLRSELAALGWGGVSCAS